MKLVKTPLLVKKILPNIIWSFPKEKGKLFFTFDDGPNPETTPFILELLRKYQAKATFFCMGKNVEQFPNLYHQILSEGHSVGNHSYSHFHPFLTRNNKYFDDISKAASLVHSDLFRPPYGRMTWSQYKTMVTKYKIVLWDVSSIDYDLNSNPEKCKKNVIENASHGSVILFHDSLKAYKNLQIFLPELMEYYSSRKFIFEKI